MSVAAVWWCVVVKLLSARRVESVPSRCIEVDSPRRLFTAGRGGNAFVSHNSVTQRTIVFATILRSDKYRFLGVDMKRVELSAYRKYSHAVLGVATDLPDATTTIQFGVRTMMERYEEMEHIGATDYFGTEDHGPALLIMVDEWAQLTGKEAGSGDEAKDRQQLKDEIVGNVQQITQLGRAAGVIMIVATQEPRGDILPKVITGNLAARVQQGRVRQTVTQMILDDQAIEGARVSASPKGRAFVAAHGNRIGHMQSFFADPSWLDEVLASMGKNPDGTPLDGSASVEGGAAEPQPILGGGEREEKYDPLSDFDADMDALIGLGEDEDF